ncbi:hypothetical protein TNCT_73401 [Trichonephila clavata]|uniref:Uncharacterized protein n=1 Tax=Trichonephila clavata TaxID=2740835 RepID=A0A8X6FXX7_TRICU|nr:hypothetical protein TNCT_73401 [Trichonephila clavata]
MLNYKSICKINEMSKAHIFPFRNGRLRVSQNGDFEPPADPQIEALVLHLELKNEDSTPSIEGRPRCPADFVK